MAFELFSEVSFISMDSFQGHPHSTWEALVTKYVSTEHLGFPLHCSTDLLSTPTLPISLKYLLAQLGSKAGILQPSHWLGPGEDFPFGEAVSCFPSPFTSEPERRDLLLQKAAKDSGSDGLGKQRAGTTILPSLHTVFWKG